MKLLKSAKMKTTDLPIEKEKEAADFSCLFLFKSFKGTPVYAHSSS